MYVQANESTASRRRLRFDIRNAMDGVTPQTGEAGGQPQISVNDTGWTNTGIGTLTSIGNGRYYADVAQAQLTLGNTIQGRYKSTNTAETPSRNDLTVVDFDPYALLSGIASAVNTALSADPDDGGHGDGSWQQKVVIGDVSGGGVAITANFTIGVNGTFNKTFQVTGLDSTGWTTFVFAIKRNIDADADADAVLLARITNGGASGDGLLIQNGQPATAAGASITVGSITPNTSVTVNIAPTGMTIRPGDYPYELVKYTSTTKTRIATGVLTASQVVLRGTTSP